MDLLDRAEKLLSEADTSDWKLGAEAETNEWYMRAGEAGPALVSLMSRQVWPSPEARLIAAAPELIRVLVAEVRAADERERLLCEAVADLLKAQGQPLPAIQLLKYEALLDPKLQREVEKHERAALAQPLPPRPESEQG